MSVPGGTRSTRIEIVCGCKGYQVVDDPCERHSGEVSDGTHPQEPREWTIKACDKCALQHPLGRNILAEPNCTNIVQPCDGIVREITVREVRQDTGEPSKARGTEDEGLPCLCRFDPHGGLLTECRYHTTLRETCDELEDVLRTALSGSVRDLEPREAQIEAALPFVTPDGYGEGTDAMRRENAEKCVRAVLAASPSEPSEEWVEAGARARYESKTRRVLVSWADLHPAAKRPYVEEARTVLRAALGEGRQ